VGNSDHKEDLQADATHDPGGVTKCVGSSFKSHHGSYRKNGYEETKGNGAKRPVYIPLLPSALFFKLVPEQQLGAALGVKKVPAAFANDPKEWDFGRGPKGRNYKSANRPFVHMYHHMVPWEVMSETFELRELRLFQAAGYNLNEGINLIILPCTERPALILGLFTHPNDHPDYTIALIDMLRNVKSKIKPKKQKHLNDEQVDGLKDILVAWETAEWFKIVAAGKTAQAKHINEYKPSQISAPV